LVELGGTFLFLEVFRSIKSTLIFYRDLVIDHYDP
jgi:hypothetical protein